MGNIGATRDFFASAFDPAYRKVIYDRLNIKESDTVLLNDKNTNFFIDEGEFFVNNQPVSVIEATKKYGNDNNRGSYIRKEVRAPLAIQVVDRSGKTVMAEGTDILRTRNPLSPVYIESADKLFQKFILQSLNISDSSRLGVHSYEQTNISPSWFFVDGVKQDISKEYAEYNLSRIPLRDGLTRVLQFDTLISGCLLPEFETIFSLQGEKKTYLTSSKTTKIKDLTFNLQEPRLIDFFPKSMFCINNAPLAENITLGETIDIPAGTHVNLTYDNNISRFTSKRTATFYGLLLNQTIIPSNIFARKNLNIISPPQITTFGEAQLPANQEGMVFLNEDSSPHRVQYNIKYTTNLNTHNKYTAGSVLHYTPKEEEENKYRPTFFFLKDGSKIAGHTFRGEISIIFGLDGEIRGFSFSQDSKINGVLYEGYQLIMSFYPNGQLNNGTPANNIQIDNIWYSKGSQIVYNEDGSVQSGRLLNETVINNITYPAGTLIEHMKSGGSRTIPEGPQPIAQ